MCPEECDLELSVSATLKKEATPMGHAFGGGGGDQTQVEEFWRPLPQRPP
jgi:hypothetical protein